MTFVDYPAIAGLASHLRGDPLTVLEPATGERLADVPSASPADVDAAAVSYTHLTLPTIYSV